MKKLWLGVGVLATVVACKGSGRPGVGSFAGLTEAPIDTCANGACEDAGLTDASATFECEAGTTACGVECADTSADPNNCGGCGTRCSGMQRCLGGVCSGGCASGSVACGSACIEANADNQHCGATAGCGLDGGSAGIACAEGAACYGGQCVTDCSDGRLACKSGAKMICVDQKNDAKNCGSCGWTCPSGTACTTGLCCPTGEVACMGVCRDLQKSKSACGGCGIQCGAGEVCANGACQ